MISSSGLQAVFSHDLVNPTEVWSLQIQGKLKIQIIENLSFKNIINGWRLNQPL